MCATEHSGHTPTLGATSVRMAVTQTMAHFNPHAHTGCDHTLDGIHQSGLVVSIHAPTRGAT